MVAHDFVVLRQPDAFALVCEFKSYSADAEKAGYLICHAHFKDCAIGQDQDVRLGCCQPVIQRHGCQGVALQAQLVELALCVSFLDLQGVLRVVVRNLPYDFLQLSGII